MEIQGKQFITESDTFASMVNFYNNVYEYHDILAQENEIWKQYVKSFTEDNKEIKEHRRTEYEKAVNCLKNLETNIKS